MKKDKIILIVKEPASSSPPSGHEIGEVPPLASKIMGCWGRRPDRRTGERLLFLNVSLNCNFAYSGHFLPLTPHFMSFATFFVEPSMDAGERTGVWEKACQM